MTTCDKRGVCYLTDEAQWSTMLVVLFVVLVIGLGIWVIVKQIIEEDIEDRVNRDIEELTDDLYLTHTAVQEETKPKPKPRLISPAGIRWLERKTRR